MKTSNLKYTFSMLAGAMFAFGLASCGGEDHMDVLSNWTWDDSDTATVAPTPDPTPADKIVKEGWTDVSADYSDLPAYIKVYNRTTTTDGSAAKAYIAVADMSQAKFEVSGDIHWSDDAGGNGNESIYTPSQFYDNNGKPAVVINGGLFFSSTTNSGATFYYSQSACYHNGALLSPNQNYWSEDWVNFWYPTIGFFYQGSDNQFHATWTYYASDGSDYSYADVKKIDRDTPDTSAPNATSPSAGTKLNDGSTVKEGIGGVGVLIHEGIIRNTWADELLNVSVDSNQPRTAVGYDKQENKLVFFVCEGRSMTEGVKGMTTGEVANLLTAIGCTEALNLDGGGSSQMLIMGKETIKGSDGSQRPVIDACFIK